MQAARTMLIVSLNIIRIMALKVQHMEIKVNTDVVRIKKPVFSVRMSFFRWTTPVEPAEGVPLVTVTITSFWCKGNGIFTMTLDADLSLSGGELPWSNFLKAEFPTQRSNHVNFQRPIRHSIEVLLPL